MDHDSYRVWIGSHPASGMRGETFNNYSDALSYYRDQTSYAGYVRLEGVKTLDEWQKPALITDQTLETLKEGE